MKESPRRYINPFLSDEENDKVNYVNNLEDENFKKSLAPSSVVNFVEKAKELYVDKNVTECNLPKLITYHEDSSFHVVKDICVDDGLSNKQNNEKDTERHNLSSNPVNGDKHDDTIKVDLGTHFLKHKHLISSPPEEYDKNANPLSVTEDYNVPSNCALDELTQFVESDTLQTKDSTCNSSTEQIVSENVLELSKNRVNHVVQQLPEVKSTESEADNVKPAIVTGSHEPPLDTQSAPNHHEVAHDNVTVSANQLHGVDESSFSVTVPISGLIAYSEPIASAGNISHRSDGSNTSVRSFAFPILQNEWNNSPIRMAKAEQRQSRKHRGWSQAILCCRF